MKKYIGMIVILLIGTQFLFSGVISAKDAEKLVKKDKAVLVSARPAGDYSKKHAKGAVNVDLDTFYKPEGVKVMLKSPEEIAKVLGQQGLTTDKKIIVYAGSNNAAGRLYWVLKYMGAKDVDILDGNIKGWKKARKPITNKKTEIEAAEFKPAVQADLYADMAYVKANLKNDKVTLVDVRSIEEFEGKDPDNANITRKGHIPSAVHFENKSVFNDDDTVKTKDEIIAAAKAAGITADKEIILYCASSVRAGIVFVALKDVAEFPNVKVYDGAYWEWNVNKDNPIK
ncbi:MAG: sulfurtransferase [Candidatus Delongbacteria bacterium]|jgi:thiosulfate/3-mercaptopyruvate sulfurtransferase|nr:sulfurtransferase [Candidatus Delongbacteria bacterium]